MATTWNTNNTIGGTQQNLSTSYKTLVNVYATTGALQRTYVSSLHVGANAAPNSTDCPIQVDVSLMTAEGTATTLTPLAMNATLETGTIAGPRSTSKGNHTAEPTVTSNSTRLARAFNQRGYLYWVAMDDQHMIVGPAVANNGWVLRAQSPNYASTCVGEIQFQE